MTMLVSSRDNSPSPLIFPFALAETTFPATLDPLGMAFLPWTVTGCATVARNVWPAWLVFELKGWSTVTTSDVPPGTIMGSGGGATGLGGGGGGIWGWGADGAVLAGAGGGGGAIGFAGGGGGQSSGPGGWRGKGDWVGRRGWRNIVGFGH